MNLQNVRWPFVLLGLAVTLGVLFGGSYVWGSKTVDEPLRALYSASEAVDTFTVTGGRSDRTIVLKLHKVQDFGAVYRHLDSETKKLFGTAPYRLEIEDSRTPELEQAFGRINLYIQEALMTGHFAEMADKVEQEAARQGMAARVSVDSERVYLQIERGDRVLYEVLQRPGDRAAAPEGGKLW